MVYTIRNQHEFIGDYTNNNLRFIPTKQVSLLLFEDAINLPITDVVVNTLLFSYMFKECKKLRICVTIT